MTIDQQKINKYLEGIDNQNTRKTYRFLLSNFIKFIQNNNISDINQQNIKIIIHDYKAYLNTQNYKATTINQHLIALKTFINDYTQIQYDYKLKLVKTLRNIPHYLTQEQIQTVLKYADDKTDELIIKLLSSTGLRIHEALKITKIGLENTDETGNTIVEIIGKNTKRRIIVIPSKLARELKIYSRDNQTYIFESRRGQPRSIRNIQYRFQKLAAKIDKEENTIIYSENLKPHNLRHSFAIHALKTNEINYVKEFLGHENIATTQIYTNLKEKEIVERFKGIGII